MRVSPIIPRSSRLPTREFEFPQKSCTFLVAELALLLIRPPPNAKELFKSDEVSNAKSAVKDKQTRRTGERQRGAGTTETGTREMDIQQTPGGDDSSRWTRAGSASPTNSTESEGDHPVDETPRVSHLVLIRVLSC